MKALEFETTLSTNNTLAVPPDLAAQIQGNKVLRVLLLVPENEEDQDWERLTAEEFGQGYAEGDAIYDQLSTR